MNFAITAEMITDRIADAIICLLELLMKLGHLILALTIASNIFNVFPARLRKVTPFHGLSEWRRISRFTSSCIIDVRRRSRREALEGLKVFEGSFFGAKRKWQNFGRNVRDVQFQQIVGEI